MILGFNKSFIANHFGGRSIGNITVFTPTLIANATTDEYGNVLSKSITQKYLREDSESYEAFQKRLQQTQEDFADIEKYLRKEGV